MSTTASKPRTYEPIAPQYQYADQNNNIDPMAIRYGGKAIIAPGRMEVGTPITLYISRVDDVENPVVSFTGVANGDRDTEINIDAEWFALFIGRTFSSRYSAVVDGEGVTSAVAELTVRHFKPEDLPAAKFQDVTQEHGGRWLDMRKFGGSAVINLCRYPLIHEGQGLWVLAMSNPADSDPSCFWVRNGDKVTEEEAKATHIVMHLSRDALNEFNDYGSVTLSTAVTFSREEGEPPTDPELSLLPANAIELPASSENLRKGDPEEPPFEEFSDFENGWGGWEVTPGTDPRDLKIVQDSAGIWYVLNYTYTNKSNGIVLSKGYSPLEVGRKYEFSGDFMRIGSVHSVPRLSVTVNGEPLIPPTDISNTTQWRSLKGEFTAKATFGVVEIVSHVASGAGNDYGMKGFKLKVV